VHAPSTGWGFSNDLQEAVPLGLGSDIPKPCFNATAEITSNVTYN